jgi:hypothetical protein
MEMKAAEGEIFEAVRKVQGGPEIISHMCIICKEYLTDWDVYNGYALCWSCRSTYFPVREIDEEKTELIKAILVRPRVRQYTIFLFL